MLQIHTIWLYKLCYSCLTDNNVTTKATTSHFSKTNFQNNLLFNFSEDYIAK